MLNGILNFLFFNERWSVRTPSVKHHLKQIERARVPQVDSSTSRAIQMRAILYTPGKYISDGSKIERIA